MIGYEVTKEHHTANKVRGRIFVNHIMIPFYKEALKSKTWSESTKEGPTRQPLTQKPPGKRVHLLKAQV